MIWGHGAGHWVGNELENNGLKLGWLLVSFGETDAGIAEENVEIIKVVAGMAGENAGMTEENVRMTEENVRMTEENVRMIEENIRIGQADLRNSLEDDGMGGRNVLVWEASQPISGADVLSGERKAGIEKLDDLPLARNGRICYQFQRDDGSRVRPAQFNHNPAELMARTTVRVELPTSKPDDFLKLIENILKEHDRLEAADAGSSPIPAKYITPLRAILASAKPDRANAKNLAAQAQALTEKSAKTLGLADGQTIRTDGTGLNLVALIRDTLETEYSGNENAMEPFGFTVVVGTAAGPKKKPAKPA